MPGRGKFFIIPAALLIVLLTGAHAQEIYYADVGIDVGADGTASISGTTNHPMLMAGSTAGYTSKKGAYWVLNITTPETFSNYLYTLRMPGGSVINYMKTSGRVAIREEGSRIIIEGVGRDEPLMIVVQYSVYPADYSNVLVYLVFSAAAALLAAVTYIYMKKAKRKPVKKRYDPDTLTERQLMIVRLLEKSGGMATQKNLETSIKIPKSSLSRNIDSLVRKGVIKRERKGMTNIVRFAE